MALTQYTGLTPTAADVVSVFHGGTQVLAAIYADSLGTAMGNPFTSDAISGQYRYWAEFAVYDEVITIAGQPLPPVAPPDSAFAIVAIQSGASVPATRQGDTLALIEGTNITLTGDTVAKTITIAVSGGGAGTPSATVAALTGSAVVGVATAYSRGDHAHADANRPATGEKAALVGTSGTPSGGNAYVTDADARNTNARAPSVHETTHRSGGSDPLSVLNLAGFTGSTTNYLRADGSFATPPSAASGALILLEQHTASASATLDFTSWYSSTYDDYVIRIVSLIPSAASSLLLRFSTDGGATYDAGASAYGRSISVAFVNSTSGGGSDSLSSISLSDANATINANGTWAGTMSLFDPGSAKYKSVTGQITVYSTANSPLLFNLAGVYHSTSAVNALRFLFSAGNINSGVIRIYGVAK